MKDVLVVPLQHHALLSYLQSRGIHGDIGRMFCREVHYELRKRRYFALAFGNAAGGYEVRNPYYKGCIRCKDISVIRHSRDETQNRVCVFEGFMDFLSYLTLKQTGDDTVCIDASCDYLVMNSVNNLKKHWNTCRCTRKSTVISTMISPGRKRKRPSPACMAGGYATKHPVISNTRT